MTRGRLASCLLAAALLAGTLSDAAPERPPLRLGGYRVLAGDFHVHTFPLSAGTIAPWDVPAEARRQGLDVVAVTGHNEVMSGKMARWWWSIAGGPTVIAGEEIHGPQFHIIALGIRETISWRLNTSDAVDEVHRQGGVAIAAHPVEASWPAVNPHAWKKFDATEVMQPLGYIDEKHRHAFERFYTRGGMTPVASSDYHGLGPIGLCRTYVFAQDDSEQAVLDALRAGRTVVFDRERIYGDPVFRELARRGGLPESAPKHGALAVISAVCGIVGMLVAILAMRR
jgi:hypothetical protein